MLDPDAEIARLCRNDASVQSKLQKIRVILQNGPLSAEDLSPLEGAVRLNRGKRLVGELHCWDRTLNQAHIHRVLSIAEHSGSLSVDPFGIPSCYQLLH